MKKYELTEEDKKELGPWADKWIKNAMSTKPMDENEKQICRKAVNELYLAAGLTPPADNRIIFVPSPFVLRFSGGFAAAIWHTRKKITHDATHAASHAATHDATYDATHDATYDATRDATRDVDDQKRWYRLNTSSMKHLSDSLGIGVFGIKCAQEAFSMWDGGNQWSSWVSFLSFFRHISKLKIDYSKFDCYEKLAIHSGPRIVHKEFCIISDRPTKLLVNDRNQSHCFDGPFCEWSDGTALYSFNGIRVPQWMAETSPENFTKEMIMNEKNADIRREIIRKIGMNKVAQLLDYKIIDQLDGYELISFDIGDGRVRPFLKMLNPSLKDVFHIEGVPPETKTVQEAICFRNGITEYQKPVSLS